MIYRILLVFSLFIFTSFTNKKTNTNATYAFVTVSSDVKKEATEESVYNSLDANSFDMPTMECFVKGLKGFNRLKEMGKVNKEFLTIVDYSLPSTVKRLWIIDTKQNKIILNSLVAHGKNSGENFATSFSNKSESNKSSLGFFITGETYIGKHGLSLKLDGLENGINDMARTRAIVMHAADYVSEAFAKVHHRLGLSHGCPALPPSLNNKIIATIKGKSCLFIYHPSMIDNTTSKFVA
ncbi:MAG: murein L,D-transpeptidase catalytic domain family protein [Bacteroidota bacterium]